MWEIRRLGFWPDFQARGKEWETRWGSFPRFPRGVISTALFIASFSERSDAGRAPVATLLLSSFSGSYVVLDENSELSSQNLAPGSPRNEDLTA
jgi:hypothetical protein